jgi:predicted 3-demethylubiquinone-9 3-methyltransferase (glyoxalase superfamily)
MNSPIVPCLWFDDQAEEAAKSYTRLFPDSRITATSHYPDSMDNPSGKPRGSVLTVEFTVAGQRMTALQGGPVFQPNPSISFFVHCDSAKETDRLWKSLAEGGEVLMALDKYPWSERYGWTKDRFGVSWQVITGHRRNATIVPCLMFAEAQSGRAEEAMKTYTKVFPEGHIDAVERYAKGEGPENNVKHGRFSIAGQEMIAMDSHSTRGATFNEGLSLQIMCDNQRDIDRYWKTLSEGGEPGPCGWLKDRFGLSWQVVPAEVGAWLTSKNAAARDRVFTAIMQMKKPDIATLQAAFDGRAAGSRTMSPQP